MASNFMVAGPYAATYNGLSLGIIGPGGFEMETNHKAEEIFGDNLGEGTMQEAISQGATVYLNFVLQELNMAGVTAAMQPFDPSGTLGALGAIGQKYTDLSRYLTLTSVYANAPVPAAWTPYHMPSAVLAPNFPIREILASRLHNVPMRFILFPFVDATDNKWKHYTTNLPPTFA